MNVEEGTFDRGSGVWASVDGTEFFYYDGTPNVPMPTRVVFDAHYLSKGIQTSGRVLSSLALCVIIAFAVWVFACRETKHVKAGQPEFLCLMCCGAALVATSGLFLSLDEKRGTPPARLDALCSAFPWFFVIGYLTIYCALFGKLWRLSKLLQMRRRMVRIHHVLMGPAILIGLSLVVLVVWQAIDPLVWERKIISVDPLETFGQCNSANHGILPFLLPLVMILVTAVLITASLSWKLRGVQSNLAESQLIFSGIFLHIQTWLVGVPMLYITHSVSRDASYIMVVSLTVTLSMSMVLLIIGPKMWVWAKSKGFLLRVFASDARTPRFSLESGGRTHISGLSAPGSGSTGPSHPTVDQQHQLAELELRVAKMTAELDALKNGDRAEQASLSGEENCATEAN